MTEVVACGLVIFRRCGPALFEFLLMRASYAPFHYTPPKGHCEVSDGSELETAKRETKEETGLNPSDYRVIDDCKETLTYWIETKKQQKRVVYWLAELLDPQTPIRLSDEHQEYVWADKNKALELIEYPDSQSMICKMSGFIAKMLPS